MPITMTRDEYEATYGVAPVLPTASKVDTSVAPRRMTRAEYEAEYSPKTQNYLQDAGSDIKQTGTNIKSSFGNAKREVKSALGASMDGEQSNLRGFGQAVGLAAGGLSNIIGDTFIGAVKTVLPQKDKLWGAIPGEDTVKGAVGDVVGAGKALDEMTGSRVSKLVSEGKKGYEMMDEAGKRDQKAKLGVASLGADFVGVGLGKKPLKRAVQEGAEVIGEAKSFAKQTKSIVDEFNEQRRVTQNAEVGNELAEEIYKIENNYSNLRKANDFSRDAGEASRQRIAQTDVLVDAVDEDGIIRTKQPGGAVDKYRAQTIDGMEDVVKQNLLREGSTLNLAQIKRALVLEVNRSGLEGADLIAALNGVKNEIKGLKLRADEFDNIPTVKAHEAKINTTKNINYLTPPETAAYRKAIARGYKTIVEENAKFDVKGVNAELSKYLDDIKRLEALDGKRVKGGKLGKYTAQIVGSLAGAGAGGAVGGMGGMAVGTIVGGEAASLVKGKLMSRTFGKARGLEAPKNSILEDAKMKGNLPPELDLRTPSPRVGAKKDIPKTKEVVKLEAEISKNVEAQKAAIKAGDFTLVAKLKEIYAHLVEKLKEVIQKIKETPNREGGFVRNPLSPSPKSGKQPGKQIKQSQEALSNSTTDAKNMQAFKNFEDLSTKLLSKLEGRTTVSKQFISDLTNSPDLKQAERDLFREVLKGEGDNINVKDFANKVKSELLPLQRESVGAEYESINLPEELRGPVANYDSHIYRSPIKTSAGEVHFGNVRDSGNKPIQDYFAHSRIEDLPSTKNLSDRYKKGEFGTLDYSKQLPDQGTTRRVIEIQSDLFQKGRLEGEGVDIHNITRPQFEGVMTPDDVSKYREAYRINKEEYTIPLSSKEATPAYKAKITKARDTIDALEKKYTSKFTEGRDAELSKLEPYRNTWHERVIREEVKQAAIDGKSKLQFPTGETAMKIEGLGESNNWTYFDKVRGADGFRPTQESIKVGQEIGQSGRSGDAWIITDVLGDGKFKAVPKREIELQLANNQELYNEYVMKSRSPDAFKDAFDNFVTDLKHKNVSRDALDTFSSEQFDISGKVDTNNPIYKFYEKEVGRYLNNKYNAELVTDPQGVKWWEVKVDKKMARMPIEAFAAAPLLTGNDE